MLSKTLAIATFILVLFTSASKAQDTQQQLQLMEDSLMVTADSMYNAFIPDDRAEHNERFVKQLVRALKVRGSYDYPFKKLQEKINIISPEDKSFRIFNWMIAPSEVMRRYYGAIQVAGDELKLYPLVDYTNALGKYAEDSVLRGGKWYGALYYRIMKHEAEGKEVYTLFGLNSSGPASNKKLMDPLIMTENGPQFGAPLFNIRSQNKPSERVKRFIIEYKKEVQASMNWDKDMNAVYFDKLVSQVNDPNRKYTYVPSGEYDGFRWNEGHWDYIQNLIPIENRKDGDAPVPAPVKGRVE